MLGLNILGKGLDIAKGLVKDKTKVAVAKITGMWGALASIGAAGAVQFLKTLGGMCLTAMLMGVLLGVFLKDEIGLAGVALVSSAFTIVGFIVLRLRYKLRLLVLKSKGNKNGKHNTR